MKRVLWLFTLLLGFSASGWAQYSLYRAVAPGHPGINYSLYLCTPSQTANQCEAAPSTAYYDEAGASPITFPLKISSSGIVQIYAAPGSYQLLYASADVADAGNFFVPVQFWPSALGVNTWTNGPTTGFWRVPTTSVNTTYGGAPFAWSNSVVLWQGTTNDNIIASGYNCGQSEALIVAGLPQFCDQMEIDFNDGIGNHWMEWHKDYTFDGVTYHRPFIIGTKLNDNTYADISFTIGTNTSDGFRVFQGTSATQLFSVTPGPLAAIRSTDQNTVFGWRLVSGATEGQFGGSGPTMMTSVDIGTDILAGVTKPALSISQSQFNFWNAGDLVGYSGIGSGEKWRITGAGAFTPAKINQEATNNFAGTCAMAAGTSCTATLTASFTSPICQVTPQGTSAIAGACSVSGTTVTITAASSNSLTWAYFVVGNPN